MSEALADGGGGGGDGGGRQTPHEDTVETQDVSPDAKLGHTAGTTLSGGGVGPKAPLYAAAGGGGEGEEAHTAAVPPNAEPDAVARRVNATESVKPPVPRPKIRPPNAPKPSVAPPPSKPNPKPKPKSKPAPPPPPPTTTRDAVAVAVASTPDRAPSPPLTPSSAPPVVPDSEPASAEPPVVLSSDEPAPPEPSASPATVPSPTHSCGDTEDVVAPSTTDAISPPSPVSAAPAPASTSPTPPASPTTASPTATTTAPTPTPTPTPALNTVTSPPTTATPTVNTTTTTTTTTAMSPTALRLDVESGFVSTAAAPSFSPAPATSDLCSHCQTDAIISHAITGAFDSKDADVVHARSTLGTWLTAPGVVPPAGHLEATCRFPWFFHHAPVDDSAGIELSVRLSSSSPSSEPTVLCCIGSSIVHRVLLDITKSMDLVAEEPIPYILKVTGRHDYLTDLKSPLQRYRYAHECQRADKPMKLLLCPLEPQDVALLYGPKSEVRMTAGYEPARVLNHVASPNSSPSKPAPRRVTRAVSPEESSRRLFKTSLSVEIPPPKVSLSVTSPATATSSSSASTSASASSKSAVSRVIPVSKMHVPFRVRPIGIENVGSSIPSSLTHFRLKFTITLGEAQLHDATVLSSFVHPLPGRAQRATPDGPPSIAVKRGRWADPFLSLGTELCSLPASARLLVQLMAVDPVTDDGQSIGCVSMSLFSEARQLRTGRWALRMFQPVSMRVDTVAPQKLGANAGQIQHRVVDTPLPILAGVPCENYQTPTSPVVLFELDSYLLPVVCAHPPYSSLVKKTSASAGAGAGGSRADRPLTPLSSAFAHTPRRMSPSVEALRRRPGSGGLTGAASASTAGSASASSATPADLSAPELHMLSELLSRDPLSVREGFTLPERRLLWKVREDLTAISSALPKLLRCISWNRLEQRAIIYSLLPTWTELEPDHALQMLDSGYGDELVRALAVLSLEPVPDTVLMGYLQSMVQMLKYETFHDSMLARFLLLRALWNPHEVGHALFWHLKSEMHLPGVANRHGLLLQVLLSRIGPHLQSLQRQVVVTEAFEAIARDAHLQPKADRTAFARRELVKQLHLLPPVFQLPLSPRMMCSGLLVDSCKILSSKKTPLWMEFVNADPFGDPVVIIYKAGDDLRQDLMTLEVIKSMEELWRQEGLDLPTQCYLCACTGDEAGMIEVVLQSETTSRIQATKSGKIVGAWAKTPIIRYLREHNPDDDAYALAVDKFVRSCAAYCVATFVLGIGDRHPSNIMLTQDGYLFHIDFGHFLGNFKEKSLLGIRVRRERAPFVFTPQMAHVMGGNRSDPLFARFEELCVKAYNTLRDRGHVLLDKFIAMLPSALPELESQADINYLRDKLALEIPPTEAADRFKKEIDNALGTVSRQIDNMVHMSVHN